MSPDWREYDFSIRTADAAEKTGHYAEVAEWFDWSWVSCGKSICCSVEFDKRVYANLTIAKYAISAQKGPRQRLLENPRMQA